MKKQVSTIVTGKKKFSPLGIPVMLFAVFWLFVAGGPFVFQIISTFKTQGEFISGGLFELPKQWSFANYEAVLKDGFYKYFFNSILVLAVSLVLLLFFSACAAYPLSRMVFKLGKPIYGVIVAAMSIPVHITLIPIFMMTIRMRIYDSIFALIGPNVAFNLPMAIVILYGFMQGISRDMENAADIDGCGKFMIFFRIIFPLSKPGLTTLAIYNGVLIWNELVFAMTLTQTRVSSTLPMAVWAYQGQYSINTPMIMALLVLSTLPVILLYIFCQDRLVRGRIAGAVRN